MKLTKTQQEVFDVLSAEPSAELRHDRFACIWVLQPPDESPITRQRVNSETAEKLVKGGLIEKQECSNGYRSGISVYRATGKTL